MPDPTPGASLWATSPTAKEKNAANRNLVALLDAIAPEKVVRRAERPRLRIERFRTPGGAVLQATNAAITLSWFPEAVENSALGELHILLWRGTVARRGTPPKREGAVVTSELVLRPIEQPDSDKVWIAADGTTYDTESLAAHCLALLENEIEQSNPADTPTTEPAD